MNGPLQLGDVVGGRYKVVGFIGEGGMQFVYRAEDSLSGRHVALKTPKNRSAKKRFRRSAIVAARVNHPNVAKTLDYVRDGDHRYLIEELIEGEDLSRALLSRTKFLDPSLAARVFHHLAKGVAAAHHAGVVHRDLKPTNVMIVGGYSVLETKITDFGIAKLAEEELSEAAKSDTLTASQTAVGALPYMAPEAIESPADVGQPADVWSLGAMLFELIAAEPPFGTGLKAVSRIVAAVPPVAPKFVTSNPQFAPLAQDLLDLALSCLEKDPNERPSADELVRKCGDLCYATSPRQEGIVSSVHYGAWGFISTPAGSVFFHQDSVYGPSPLQVGDRVVFCAFEGGGANRAHPVIKLTSS